MVIRSKINDAVNLQRKSVPTIKNVNVCGMYSEMAMKMTLNNKLMASDMHKNIAYVTKLLRGYL